MSLKIYGIKNCNTVKSALNWLDENGVAYEFHDFKTKGVTAAQLKDWVAQVGWETLVHKRGTTWRKLSPEEQSKVKSASSAIALMKEKTSVIKRPVVEADGELVAVGFDPDEYAEIKKRYI